MDRAGEPAAVVDRTLAEHRVELCVLGRRIQVGEACGEALALDRVLLEAPDRGRGDDAEELVDGRNDVDGVDVLLPWVLLRLDARRPRDEARVGDAALVSCPALPVRER